MSNGEYLRRKLERLPTVIGPARYGDEGLKTMVARYKASVRRPVGPPNPDTCCRGKKPYWRTTGLPDSGPYPRAADGQQQEWSSDFVAASKAGCAVCTTGLGGYVYKPCCPAEPEDLTRKPLALQGKQTCCPVYGPPLSSLPPDCCDAPGPGRVNTLWANDMPSDRNPYLVPIRDCKPCPPVGTGCECPGDC